jgi:hypothetical protein
MDDQGTDVTGSGIVLRLFRLAALMLSGAYLGYVCFAIICDERDGIYMDWVARRIEWAIGGVILGLIIEFGWRAAGKSVPRRFSLRTLIIAMTLVSITLGVLAVALRE